MPAWTLYLYFSIPHSRFLDLEFLPHQIRTHLLGQRKSLSQLVLPRIDHREDVSTPGLKTRSCLWGLRDDIGLGQAGAVYVSVRFLRRRSEPGWEGQAGARASSLYTVMFQRYRTPSLRIPDLKLLLGTSLAI